MRAVGAIRSSYIGHFRKSRGPPPKPPQVARLLQSGHRGGMGREGILKTYVVLSGHVPSKGTKWHLAWEHWSDRTKTMISSLVRTKRQDSPVKVTKRTFVLES